VGQQPGHLDEHDADARSIAARLRPGEVRVDAALVAAAAANVCLFREERIVGGVDPGRNRAGIDVGGLNELPIVARLHEINDVSRACAGWQPEPVEVVQVSAESFGAAGVALRAFEQLRIDPLQSAFDRDARISLAHAVPERLGVAPAAAALSAAGSDGRNERCGLTQFDDDADATGGLPGRVLWRVRHTSAPSRCICARSRTRTTAPRVRDREKTPTRRGFAKMASGPGCRVRHTTYDRA
jgi:hypothetical protein